MASRGEFQITDPEGVDMTLTITMSVREWRRIRECLSGNSVCEWSLKDTISRLVADAEKKFSFYEEIPK